MANDIKENANLALTYSILGLILPVLGTLLLIFAAVRATRALKLIKKTGAGEEYRHRARVALTIVFGGLLATLAIVWWSAFWS